MGNLEPIRKPNHKGKFELNRFRTVARLAGAKCFYDGKSIQLYTEFKADFDGLCDSLLQMLTGRENAGSMRTVAQVASSIGTYSTSFRNLVAQNLKQWELRLRSTAAKRGQRQRLRNGLSEIEFLTKRLREISEFSKWVTSVNCPEFLLSESQENELKSICQPGLADQRHQDLLRVIYWLKGGLAAKKYLAALQEVRVHRTTHVAELEFVRDKMQNMRRDPDQERMSQKLKLLSGDELFQQTLQRVRLRQDWKGFKSSKSASRNLGAGVVAYTRVIHKNQYSIDMFLPAVLACWALNSDSDFPFPVNLIHRHVNSGFKSAIRVEANFVAKLERRRGLRGLNDLILDENIPSCLSFLHSAIVWIENGATKADIQFAARLWQSLKLKSTLNLKRFCQITTRLIELFDIDEVQAAKYLASWIEKPFSLETIERLIRWLGRFPHRILPEVKFRFFGLLSLFEDEDFSTSQTNVQPYVKIIDDWNATWNEQFLGHAHERNLPKQLRMWVRRLSRYQLLCQSPSKLPNSVQKLVELPEKRMKELRYLLVQQTARKLTRSMQQRLDYLRQTTGKSKHIEKAIRAIQEAVLVTGLEALRSQFLVETRRQWRERTRHSLPQSVSLKNAIALSRWVQRMNGFQIRLLREILHVSSGCREYRSRLKSNSIWLQQAKLNGLRIDRWFGHSDECRLINGCRYRLYCSRDPFEIFFMGSFFKTCLGQGRCNEMSVLANAADANKHVLFVVDEKQNIIARKLIAISKKHELVGYFTYCVFGEKFQQKRDDIVNWISQYCGRLAFEIGVSLSNEGIPISVCRQFWYDDGEEDWSSHARDEYAKRRAAARLEECSQMQFVIPPPTEQLVC